nr:hypothetical protein [Xanthomonas cassavae]
MRDALPYVLQFPSEDFVAKVLAANDALHPQGVACVKLKNYCTSGDGTYRGILGQARIIFVVPLFQQRCSIIPMSLLWHARVCARQRTASSLA